MIFLAILYAYLVLCGISLVIIVPYTLSLREFQWQDVIAWLYLALIWPRSIGMILNDR